MRRLLSLVYKVLIFIDNKKAEYIFSRSRRYIKSWGVGTYGYPKVICYDGTSRLDVGKYVSFSSNVSILLGSNHKRGLVTTYPKSLIDKNVKQNETNERGDVSIGSDVWIGYGATVIGPVTIGDGAIIGAGAVVVRDIPAFAVAVGVPAKVVKFRFEENQIQDLLKIKWWDRSKAEINKIKEDLFSSDIKDFIYKNQ